MLHSNMLFIFNLKRDDDIKRLKIYLVLFSDSLPSKDPLKLRELKLRDKLLDRVNPRGLLQVSFISGVGVRPQDLMDKREEK